MTLAIQKCTPVGRSLLRCFRFDGLDVAQVSPAPTSRDAVPAPCEVLLAVDFAGTAGGTLAERLADAGQRLTGGGVLLLALPNRFGLRFWSGCPEPATGRLFATLAGPAAIPESAAAGPGGLFTSRRELADSLAAAGFSVLEWFFAAPDGGETGESGALISEHLVAAAPELAAELASEHPSADPARVRLDLFPETLVGRELARSGLFAEFANYFLVAAAPRRTAAGPALWARLRPPAPEIGWHFAAGRRAPVATVFEHGSGGVTVAKRRLEEAARSETAAAAVFGWSAPERSPLAPGVPLRLRLQEHLVAGRFENFLDELAAFAAAIRARFGSGEALAEAALDATLANATRDTDGEFHLFDLEWRATGGMPLSWWVLRNVLACLEMRGPRWTSVPTAGDLYTTLCRQLAIPPQFAADLAREAEFGAAARSRTPDGGGAQIEAALARPWPVPVAQGLDTAELRSALESAAAHQQLVADYRRLEHWAAEAQQRAADAEAAYRRLESWATEVQQANEAVLADYRKLAEWATALEAELGKRSAEGRS